MVKKTMKIQTEGIKYTGSKLKILPFITEKIRSVGGVRRVFDGFSGTTRVAQCLYQEGYEVTANDSSVWSDVFARCYLLSRKPLAHYQELIDYLNSLDGRYGWFSEHYGGLEQDTKRPFQMKNTMRLDAIREELDRLDLDLDDKCVALTSLVLALDAVDSTLGHYVSYLAEWSKRSYNDLKLCVPHICYRPELPEARVFCEDIFDAVHEGAYDLAYYDPPYGSNNEKMPPSRVRYSAYYHIWKSVILNDRPKLFGKANRREDSRDEVACSVFEEFRRAPSGRFVVTEAIDRLLRETQAEYVLLSYSSGGRATKSELMEVITGNGELVDFSEIDYRKNVMASMKWSNEWAAEDDKNKEYLFLIRKR